jgi:hypothetical protein
MPGAITPPLQPEHDDALQEIKPPLTEEEGKFSTYQFESQMTFKNALATNGQGLNQVESNSTEDQLQRKQPKQRFTPGVFHNLF